MIRLHRQKIAEVVFTLVAALAVGYLFLSLNDPIVRDVRSWYDGTSVAPDIPINHAIDNVIQLAMPSEGGNIVLDLPAMVREPDVPPESVGRVFARGAYLVWPRRFYPVPTDRAVVWARDMRDMATPADPQWLADHDVRFYVRIPIEDGPPRVLRIPVITPKNPQR